jgi:hypothetical protein
VLAPVRLVPAGDGLIDKLPAAETEDGYFVRRLLAPHLARETIIVTLRPAGRDVASAWADAHASEPAWLDNDLATLDLPPLAAFWP